MNAHESDCFHPCGVEQSVFWMSYDSNFGPLSR